MKPASRYLSPSPEKTRYVNVLSYSSFSLRSYLSVPLFRFSGPALQTVYPAIRWPTVGATCPWLYFQPHCCFGGQQASIWLKITRSNRSENRVSTRKHTYICVNNYCIVLQRMSCVPVQFHLSHKFPFVVLLHASNL